MNDKSFKLGKIWKQIFQPAPLQLPR